MKNTLRAFLFFTLTYLLAPTTASADATTIYACELQFLGTIRLVSAATPCTRYETKISWNSTGVQGPPGATGAAGLAGPQGPAGPSGVPSCTAPDIAVLYNGAFMCKSAVPRFVDGGDGTEYDTVTGLRWEKKDATCTTPDYNNPHCILNKYRSAASNNPALGVPTVADFLAAINRDETDDPSKTSCLGNSCQWRLPRIDELKKYLTDRIASCGVDLVCRSQFTGNAGNAVYGSSTIAASGCGLLSGLSISVDKDGSVSVECTDNAVADVLFIANVAGLVVFGLGPL